MEERSPKRPARVRAVPWKTPVDEQVRGALGEIPAWARRAKRTEDAVSRLFATAREVREEMLLFVCLRLRRHLDALGPGTACAPAIEALESGVRELDAWRRIPSRPPRGRRPEETTLPALRESVRRFNRRWRSWIAEDAPIAAANREIEGMNRYFRIERQAAARHVPLDGIPNEKKALLVEEDLLRELPLLPIP